MSNIKYNIYPSLLDSFQDYLDSSELYSQYWGNSDNPEKTEEEFEAEQFQCVIDQINRIPFENEAADKGTAFNEAVDCIIENRTSTKMLLSADENYIKACYKENTFMFPRAQTIEFAKRFSNGICQVYTDGILNTSYGNVLLYGYIDELLPTSCHDIKTTSKYKAGKFRKKWQKVVYPFCLNEQGNYIKDFEYNIVVFNKDGGFETYDEYYNFTTMDENRLITYVEKFIDFLEMNRHLITDEKIFNLNTPLI